MSFFDFLHFKPKEKGVSKEEARLSSQTDFKGFFVTLVAKFWNLSNLNLIIGVYIVLLALGVWQLSAYPVVFYIFLAVFALIFGLICVGTTYVVRGYVRGDPVYLLSDFKYAVSKNIKQGIIIGIIDIAVIALLVFDIFFWSGMDLNYLSTYVPESQVTSEISKDDAQTSVSDEVEISSSSSDTSKKDGASDDTEVPSKRKDSFTEGIFFYSCIFLLIIYMFMRNYIYLITVTFNLSIFKIFKNSFIFAFLGLKRNLPALIGSTLVCFLNFYIFVYMQLAGILLFLIITPAVCSFIGVYTAYPVIKKYMITPYYKDDEVFDSYDKIFEDRG